MSVGLTLDLVSKGLTVDCVSVGLTLDLVSVGLTVDLVSVGLTECGMHGNSCIHVFLLHFHSCSLNI